MTKPTLEQISAALFAKAQTVAGLRTCAREFRDTDNVPASEQAALFQCEDDDDVLPSAPSGGGRSHAPPSSWVLHFTWYVYQHRTNVGDGLLATAVNTLIDACSTALAPDAGAIAQTLGGLVKDCRIAGTITRDGGLLTPQGLALIPIEVRTFAR